MLCAQCLRRLDTGAQRCPACGGDPLLGGRYRLDRPLAEGPSESSYRATRVEDGLLVRVRAVDVARASLDAGSLREAAAQITKLEHRCLPRALEHCEIEGRLWLVHEYVRGRTLAELATDEPLRVREPVWSSAVLAELASVLTYLHARVPAIAHGQISAANIWVADGSEPRFCLLDLQLANTGSPAADVRALGSVLERLLVDGPIDPGLVGLLDRMRGEQPITAAALADAVAGLARSRRPDEHRHPPTLARPRRPTPQFMMLETVSNPDGSVTQAARPVPPAKSRVATRRRGDDIPLVRPDELSRELSQAYRATAAFEERQRKQLAVARVAVVLVVAMIAALATILAMHGV